MSVILVDPARYSDEKASPNIGDQIISRASKRELNKIFNGEKEIISIPSHSYLSNRSRSLLKEAKLVIVGGSNLLWFRPFPPASWPIGPRELMSYKNVVFMGVGWGSYEIPATRFGRFVLRKVANQTVPHSARDGFTAAIMRDQLGLPNTLNTGCHTLWSLTEDHLSAISQKKAKNCIFSLTDYRKDIVADSTFLNYLQDAYGDNLMFWPQGAGDEDYVKSLGYSGFVIKRELSALISILETTTSVDYIGTRLHAGVLCLEYGLRTLIVSVDNRATEIGKDTALPVIERGAWDQLETHLTSSSPISLSLQQKDINSWRHALAEVSM